MTSAVRTADAALARLEEFTVIRVAGPDADAYLQGQLSADVGQLTTGRSSLACLNSPQGRVQAVVWLVRDDEGVLVVCPREIESRVVERLRRYVLRAKVTVEALGTERRCYAGSCASLQTPAAAAALTEPVRGVTARAGGSVAVRVSPHEDRCLVLGPPPGTDGTAPADGSTAWRLAEVRAGHPQVYDATWESFVAQMLNLDLLGAISFAKGCYTGQEIIARAHYRGAVKRRMVRLRAAGDPPPPGSRVLAGDDSAGEVVSAATDGEACELLAVLGLSRLEADLRLESGAALERLALPYEVPSAA